MNAQAKHQIGQAWGRLVDQLTVKQGELVDHENSCGKAHDVRRVTKLRQEIASLKRRIELAERLMEAAE